MPSPISGPIDLVGQVALVTGGAGGIGSATVKALVREGAAVAIVARRRGEAEAIERNLGVRDARTIALGADVTDRSALEAAVDETIHRFGRLDIAVQSAGVVSGTPLMEVTDAEWATILDVNLKGTLHVLQSVYPVMAAAGYGKIVCLGSIAGEQGGVMSGPHYVAAKAGIHAMIKWVAKAGAPHNVYVNAIAPGPVMTPMWIGVNKGIAVDDPDMSPLGRVGRPEDIAEAVLFLVSSMSNWITGTVLDVNGGMLMR